MSLIRSKLPTLTLRAEAPARPNAPASALAVWNSRLAAKKTDDNTFTIEVMDVISPSFGVNAQMVNDALKGNKKKSLTVQINSPGGDVAEGIAIYNMLRAHEGEVTVRVIGLAASIASIIAMAGDKIVMDESAMMMVHRVWGLAVGNQEDLQEIAKVMDLHDKQMAGIYSARTGMPIDEVEAMMSAETWMTAKDAVEKKFADAWVPNKQPEKKKQAARAAADAALLAASGQGGAVHLFASARQQSPSAMGSQGATSPVAALSQGTEMKTVAEQIAGFEAKRATSMARIVAIMGKASDEGRSLEEAEATEHDGLKAEVKSIDEHIVRLKDLQTMQAASAAVVDPAASGVRTVAREEHGSVRVESNLPKGTAFTRYCMALAMSKGDFSQAILIAENRWKQSTPQVVTALKAAAVNPGDTSSADWAGPLVTIEQMASEFIELLRPMTILGRMTGLRRVPFNIKMPRQLTGSTVGWVGQGTPKPVGQLTFDTVQLGFSKVAGIVVITKELARLSNPSAEALVRQDLLETIAKFQDEQFITPSVAAVAGVSPASVTNGVSGIDAGAYTVAAVTAAVRQAMQGFIDANLSLLTGVWIMNPRTALSLSLLRSTTEDTFAFPTITPQGGTFMGLPVITSNSVPILGTSGSPTIIVLANAGDILLADDGGISVDVSEQASIQMDSAPETGAMSLVSLWQNNLVGLRAERMINWLKRRSAAVQVIEDVVY